MKNEVGKVGERIAERHLREKGFKFLARNYTTPLGEIDLIGLDGKTLVFVEVKAATGEDFGDPECRVDAKKQRQIIKASLSFLKAKGLMNSDCRFDVVGIRLNTGSKPEIEHIENAFTA